MASVLVFGYLFFGMLWPAGASAVSAVSSVTVSAPVGVSGSVRTVNAVLPGPLGASAEATAAIDPAQPHRMAVGGDPYLASTHIQVSISTDGGQHWSGAVNVLPPGMLKSYDPQLAFTADHSLLVVGGASPDPQSGCQRHSTIFLALIRGQQVTYTTIASAGSNGLLDRPTFVIDNARARIVASWTASTGPDAACRLRPETSTTWVARITDNLRVLDTEALPRTTIAPFGSSVTVSGNGMLGLVVAGRDEGDGLTVVVYRSADAHTWTASRVGHGRAQPDSLAGLGGAVLSMPTISGLADGFAVAWTDASSGTARTRLTESRGGGWTPVAAPPAAPTAITLLPTIGSLGKALLLVQAVKAGIGLRFDTWQQQGGNWTRTSGDDAGPIKDRHELGEALGLATGPSGQILTAVPVDVSGASALLVRTAAPPVVVTRSVRPSGPRSGRAEAPTGLQVVAGGGAIVMIGFLTLLRRRHREPKNTQGRQR